MKIIFLDFDGVISTFEKGWTIDIEKVKLINEITRQTMANIVVTSSWRIGYDNVDHFIKGFGGKVIDNGVMSEFLSHIFDITDSFDDKRGEQIERWLHNNGKYIDEYVILDDENDFNINQLFNFVQTDSYEGITEREVKLCVKILNGFEIPNPIRLNLVLTMMWRNNVDKIQENNINELLSEYHRRKEDEKKRIENELSAEIYAYRMMGSSPCEDCVEPHIRHCGEEALNKCWENGGCHLLDDYHKKYEEYKKNYKND